MSRNLREPADVLDPRHFVNVRKPTAYAETLPGWCFTSQTFYDYERERIFFKTWNCVGHVSRVPNPGDYITFDFMDVPVLITRAEDGKVRAFTNACRHRGAELVSGAGNCKLLKCPYHAWAYALDGSLVGTPMFDESDAFQKADYGLRAIKMEIWAGFMWINFDPHCEPLARLSRRSAGPGGALACRRHGRHISQDLSRRGELEAILREFQRSLSCAVRAQVLAELQTRIAARIARSARNTSAITLCTAPGSTGRAAFSTASRRYPKCRSRKIRKGAFYPWVYPNTGMGFQIDSMFCVEIYPEGPERTRLERSFLVPRAFTALPDFHATVENYLLAMEKVQFEDVDILESQQRAVHSPLVPDGSVRKAR